MYIPLSTNKVTWFPVILLMTAITDRSVPRCLQWKWLDLVFQH